MRVIKIDSSANSHSGAKSQKTKHKPGNNSAQKAYQPAFGMNIPTAIGKDILDYKSFFVAVEKKLKNAGLPSLMDVLGALKNHKASNDLTLDIIAHAYDYKALQITKTKQPIYHESTFSHSERFVELVKNYVNPDGSVNTWQLSAVRKKLNQQQRQAKNELRLRQDDAAYIKALSKDPRIQARFADKSNKKLSTVELEGYDPVLLKNLILAAPKRFSFRVRKNNLELSSQNVLKGHCWISLGNIFSSNGKDFNVSRAVFKENQKYLLAAEEELTAYFTNKPVLKLLKSLENGSNPGLKVNQAFIDVMKKSLSVREFDKMMENKKLFTDSIAPMLVTPGYEKLILDLSPKAGDKKVQVLSIKSTEPDGFIEVIKEIPVKKASTDLFADLIKLVPNMRIVGANYSRHLEGIRISQLEFPQHDRLFNTEGFKNKFIGDVEYLKELKPYYSHIRLQDLVSNTPGVKIEIVKQKNNRIAFFLHPENAGEFDATTFCTKLIEPFEMKTSLLEGISSSEVRHTVRNQLIPQKEQANGIMELKGKVEAIFGPNVR